MQALQGIEVNGMTVSQVMGCGGMDTPKLSVAWRRQKKRQKKKLRQKNKKEQKKKKSKKMLAK